MYFLKIFLKIIDMYAKESVGCHNNILANIPKNNMSNNTDVGGSEIVVSIMVFYESFCPGSREFITTILKDTFEKVGQHMWILWIPYGNAKTEISNGNYVFTCQHGPKECYGNMLHACAIDYFHYKNELIEPFIVCLMDQQRSNSGSDDEAADQCGKLLNFDPLPIKMCAKGVVGQCLHTNYAVQTSWVNPTYVPYVLVDYKPLDPRSYPNLTQVVCEKLVPKPSQCKSSIF